MTDRTDPAADAAFLDEYAVRWLAAWNSHETDALLAIVSPDIEWDDRTFWTEVLHGREALREYVEAIWRAMPDVEFEEIGHFVDPHARRGVVLFRQHGHAPEALGGEAATFDAHGCDIFLEFDDAGLLRRYLASYDISGMLVQMGALPERGGRLGGAYLLSLKGSR